MNKTHYFYLTIAGDGSTVEEAWGHAVEQFSMEPGEPAEYEIIDDDETDEELACLS